MKNFSIQNISILNTPFVANDIAPKNLASFNDGIVIRSLGSESIDELTDFQNRNFDKLDHVRKTFVAPRGREYRQNVIDTGGTLYAAIDTTTGKIVSSAIGCYIDSRQSFINYMSSHLLAGEFAYADFPQIFLTTLLVDKTYWGRGLCQKIFRAVHADAQQRKLPAASLCVSTDNVPGIISAFHAGYSLIGCAHHTRIDHPVFLFTQESVADSQMASPVMVGIGDNIGWLELQNYLDAGYCCVNYDPYQKTMIMVPYRAITPAAIFLAD